MIIKHAVPERAHSVEAILNDMPFKLLMRKDDTADGAGILKNFGDILF
jgi:hypothetical protein